MIAFWYHREVSTHLSRTDLRPPGLQASLAPLAMPHGLARLYKACGPGPVTASLDGTDLDL